MTSEAISFRNMIESEAEKTQEENKLFLGECHAQQS